MGLRGMFGMIPMTIVCALGQHDGRRVLVVEGR